MHKKSYQVFKIADEAGVILNISDTQLFKKLLVYSYLRKHKDLKTTRYKVSGILQILAI